MENNDLVLMDLKRIEDHLKNPESAPWRWIFYGDSVTQGAAHTEGWRCFPEIFAERLRWEIQWEEGFHCLALDTVINHACSGWTTDDLLEHYDSRIRAFQPDLVSVMIGINDTVRPGIPAEFEKNLTRIVLQIRQDHAIPLLHTCNRIVPANAAAQLRFRHMEDYMTIIRKVAHEQQIILVDNYANWPCLETQRKELEKWLGEPMHPGGIGHLEIAKLMTKTLGMYSEQSVCLHPKELTK